MSKSFLPIIRTEYVQSGEVNCSRHAVYAFITALVGALLFFAPSLVHQGKIGFVFGGDTWNLITAQFVLSGHYAAQGVFAGVDIFTHGGASEFFLRPNLPIYHPLVLLLSPLAKADNPGQLASLYVIIMFVHAFLGCYFLHRLAMRFLRCDLPLATFIALGGAFSVQMVHALWYLPFAVIGWTMPMAIYAGLHAARAGNYRSLVLASLPVFLIYVAGYVPMALGAIMLSQLSILVYEFYQARDLPRRSRMENTLAAFMPAVLASLIAAPYYLAVAKFHHLSEIANRGSDNIFEIAHQLTEVPQNLFRLLASNLAYPGPLYEFSLFWGLVPVLVFILYLNRAGGVPSVRMPKERMHYHLMLFSLAIYTLFALAIFGVSSAVSDIFYYFVPILGSMHLYQRYQVLSQLFLIVFTGLMLNEVLKNPRLGMVKGLAVFVTVLIIAVAQLLHMRQPLWDAPAVNGGLVIELVYALLFLIGIILCERRTVLYLATVLMLLVSLAGVYRYSSDSNLFLASKRQEEVSLNRDEVNAIASYFSQNSPKALIKYVDLISHPGAVSKNLPWFMLGKVRASSYYGYDWHLAADYRFRDKMPAAGVPLEMLPDWDWVHHTGADFVIYQTGNLKRDPKLQNYIDSKDSRHVFHLGNKSDIVIAPLKFEPPAGEPVVFDNGFVRVQSAGHDFELAQFKTNDAGKMSFTTTSASPARLTYLLWPGSHLQVYIDGKKVTPEEGGDLWSFDVASGQHAFQFVYRNWPLKIFLLFYALYAVAVLLALAGVGMRSFTRKAA